MSIFSPNARLSRTQLLAGEAGVRGALYRSAISLDDPPSDVKPGQFFMVRAMPGPGGQAGFGGACGSDPLLPRALSALDYEKRTGTLHVCYRIYGAGTALLASLAPGDPLQVYGPRGNGFALKEVGRRPVVLVGGGVGVPPLYLWAKALKSARKEVLLFQGARTKKELLLLSEFRRLGVPVKVSTDDGSQGFKGRVGDLLRASVKTLEKSNPHPIVYTCGPLPMMRDVAEAGRHAGFPCRVSMEERMACGSGVCLACVVPVERDGERKNVPSCIQGPVFDANEVIW